ncbi:dipeptide/oligopeptide/nickel ABC transporter permease/ATP-binding protein [Microbacterium forte]
MTASTTRPRRISWFRQILRRPAALVSLIVIVGLLLTAIFAPMFLTDAAMATDPLSSRLAPSLSHPFGTDELGRDILLRTLVAARPSLFYALGAVLITTVLGVSIGLLAAVLGPRARQALFQISATATAFPAILLAVILATTFGRSGTAAMLGLAIATVPYTARITMTLAVGVAGTDQIAAARAVGVRGGRLVRYYVLPQIAEPLATITIMAAAGNLIAMSALSFVGLGVQPPDWDWGAMLSGALREIYTNPIALLGPGVAIVVAGAAINMFGESLAATIDPRNRTRGPRSALTPQSVTAPSVVAPRTTDAVSADGSDVILDIRDLRVKTVGEHPIDLVHGVDLDIRAGERVGIVGESGSGKSLTLAAAAKLLPAGITSASASHRFLGSDVRTLRGPSERRALGDRVAMVFQDPVSTLNPLRRIGAILSDKLRAHERVTRGEARKRVVGALEEVGIPDPSGAFDRYPHEFSGGQRQRIMIAMALLGDTRLLLADEPTTALDVSVQRQIATLLRRVSDERGIAFVLVSHDVALVSELCDRILVMQHGRVVEDGTTEQILTAPTHPYTRELLEAIPAETVVPTASAARLVATERTIS